MTCYDNLPLYCLFILSRLEFSDNQDSIDCIANGIFKV